MSIIYHHPDGSVTFSRSVGGSTWGNPRRRETGETPPGAWETMTPAGDMNTTVTNRGSATLPRADDDQYGTGTRRALTMGWAKGS